ncbi:MAG: hypothetical protein KDE52_08830 [Calditrichaeota bacterium]|nr:hypothetical protein [Calditrichota bacterium]MCB0286509.1 hypothetical protein [Calditrichota bacterium]MCB0300146.1 hypothetical protein [Calditrichota bacterium]
MLQTSIGLKREFTTDGDAYFVLEIGMDPETRVSIVEPDMNTLLTNLPEYLTTIIQTQILIDQPAKEDAQ